MSLAHQVSLFGGGEPAFDRRFRGLVRYELGGNAWVEHLPGWVRGHEQLFEQVRDGTRWRAGQRTMYERVVDVPRLVARLPEDGAVDPLVAELARALSAHTGWLLDRISAALYRDGRDSVAWHGDRMGELRPDCVVATVSLGEPRPFRMRRVGGGPSRSVRLGWGDLWIMGGSCQQTWEHCVPKVASAGPRISLMFRPAAAPLRGAAS